MQQLPAWRSFKIFGSNGKLKSQGGMNWKRNWKNLELTVMHGPFLYITAYDRIDTFAWRVRVHVRAWATIII
jgi:hypothetical protein